MALLKKPIFIIFLTVVCSGFLMSVPSVLAADLLITPLLIDEEVVGRDVVTKNITVTNQRDFRLVYFATVNEVEIDTTGKIKEFITPSMTDRTNTVTSWLEITRGRLEIDPGASTTIPLTIRIDAYAKPGTYYAFVGLVSADNQPEAQAKALRGDADGTILKITLKDTKSELLRISTFLIDRFVFLKSQREISVEVENSGDAASVPTGEIIFYNSRGEEVASTDINSEQNSIPAKEKRFLKAEVPFEGKLGRFKANLTLDYGIGQKTSIFDTTQFFMIPIRILAVLGFVIIFFSVVVTYLLRRAFHDELHDEEGGREVPLHIRNDREHDKKDHDIHISKT